ncbi:FeoB-associated Cys-rich membrane protein [Porphyromonas sp.]
MLQEIIVFALLAVVLFFLGRALYRMILPKKDDGKGHGGCSGCSGCCH